MTILIKKENSVKNQKHTTQNIISITSTLMLSSFLCMGTVMGAQANLEELRLSDACTIGVPARILQIQDTKDKNAQLTKWQQDIDLNFQEKCKKLGCMNQQLKDLFADLTIEEGEIAENWRSIARALRTYYSAKLNKAADMRIQFKGHKGLDIPAPKDFMREFSLGEYASYLAKMDKISKEILGIESKKSQEDLALDQNKTSLKNYQESKEKQQTNLLEKSKELEVIAHSLSEAEDLQTRMSEEKSGIEQALANLHPRVTEMTSIDEKNIRRERLAKQVEDLQVKLNDFSLDDTDENKASKEQLTKELESLTSSLTELTSECETFQPERERVQNQVKELNIRFNAATEALEKQKQIVSDIKNSHESKLWEVEAIGTEMSIFEKDIDQLSQKIQDYPKIIQEFNCQITDLEAKKQEETLKAETYALIKYVTALNNYAALPNSEFNLHEYDQEDQLHTISPEMYLYLRSIMNNRAATVGASNLRLGVDREISKVTKIIEESKIIFDNKLKTYVENIEYDINGDVYWKGDRERVSKIIANYNNQISFPDIMGKYALVNKENNHNNNTSKYCYYSQEKNEEDFNVYLEEYPDKNQSDRVDHQIKKSMMKWKARTGNSSLIQTLALNGTFLNAGYVASAHPTMISFKTLLKRVDKNICMEILKTLDQEKGRYWTIGLMQMKVNYFDSYIKVDQNVINRTKPIYGFIESKIKTQLENGKKEKKVVDHKIHDIHHAFLKYVSYASMAYTLTHDHLGNKLADLLIVDPIMDSKNMNPQLRVDLIMAAKAYKWGVRVLELGDDFIAKNALKAWVFEGIKGNDWK